MERLISWVHHYYKRGTDSRRQTYASMKGMLIPRQLSERRSLARAHATNSPFNIPLDQGLLIFPPGRFPEATEIVAEASAVVSEKLAEGVNWPRKQQLRTDLLDSSVLTLDSPYLRFALRPDILACVSAYLGVVPILKTIDVWYSQNHPGEFNNSQLFHCDGADRTQVKIFVYCSKVDLASGPLSVIGAATSKSVREKLNYTFGGKRYRVKDEEMYSLVEKDCKESIIGPVGTVAFVDTSRCFHYGSRLAEGASPRTVALFQFLTPTAFDVPIGFRKNTPFSHLVEPGMPRLQRLVLGDN